VALKFGTDVGLEKLEGEASYFKRSIEDIKTIQEGGDEGLKIALKIFKSYLNTVSNTRANCYVNTDQNKMLQALTFAGEERALNFVIQLFENPKSNIQFYQEELERIEKQIRDYKKYPRRD